MGTTEQLAVQFSDWIREQKEWAELNGTCLELVLFPGDAEAALVEAVTLLTPFTEADPIKWSETKDHRVSIRMHDVKVGFDNRIPSNGYMLRFGHPKKLHEED